MAAADVIAETVATNIHPGDNFFHGVEFEVPQENSSTEPPLQKTVKKDFFVLNNQSFVDLQVYLKAAMKLPSSKERFEAFYPPDLFAKYMSKDKKIPPLYKAIEQVLVDINNHCANFSSETMHPMISLAGNIANFAETASSRSTELKTHLEFILNTPLSTNDPSVREKIDDATNICLELVDEAKLTRDECEKYQKALGRFKDTTETDKADLEAVNARAHAVLPTTNELSDDIRQVMEEAANKLRELAKKGAESSDRLSFKSKESPGPPWYYYIPLIGRGLCSNKKSVILEMSEVDASFRSLEFSTTDSLMTCITFRERSQNLEESMQEVTDAIQKAETALQHMMGCFSNLETNLTAVANKLDSIKGNIASGSQIRLKRAFKIMGEAGEKWSRVVDLAQSFQDNGLIVEKSLGVSDELKSKPWRVELVSASYGSKELTSTARILFNDGANLRINSNETGFGSNWKGQPQAMSVLHQFGKEKRIFACKPDTGTHNLKLGDIKLSIDDSSTCNEVKPYPKPDGVNVQILAIVYGPEEVRDEKVYEYCYSHIQSDKLIEWSNENFGGDTWVGHLKPGTIYYTLDGGNNVRQCSGYEGTTSHWVN